MRKITVVTKGSDAPASAVAFGPIQDSTRRTGFRGLISNMLLRRKMRHRGRHIPRHTEQFLQDASTARAMHRLWQADNASRPSCHL